MLPRPNAAAGVTIESIRVGATELAALRGRTRALEAIAASRGVAMAPIGRVVAGTNALVLSVRPERWLLVTASAAAGANLTQWQDLCAGIAAAVDQSGGLAAFYLSGANVGDVLARGCRLDLSADAFPPGHAAATSMAQVSTILAAMPAGILILTPASTARHLHEWLLAAARPFGLGAPNDPSVSTLFGHQVS